MRRILSLLLLTAIGPAAAMAQTNTPVINKKQANQAARIEDGKASGALNDKEAARLQQGQARVQKMKQNAAADGTTSSAERAKIRAVQSAQSKRIAKQKHDAQTK